MTDRTTPKPAHHNPDVQRTGPGVYNLEDIRERCRIDAITGCWSWAMAVSDGSRSVSRTPRVSLPKGVISATHRTVSVPRVAWLMAGHTLREGLVVWRTCCNDLCCNPAHLKAGTKRQEGAWMAANGHRKGDPRRVAVALRNVAGQAVPMETVRAIEERLRSGELQRAVAEAVGIHEATVSKIARGLHYHQRNRGLVRGASVFALAGASA